MDLKEYARKRNEKAVVEENKGNASTGTRFQSALCRGKRNSESGTSEELSDLMRRR